MITQSRLQEICDYNPNTGLLIWKEAGKKRVVGNIIGSIGSHGYMETSIEGHRYLVHRLVWFWNYGEFPIAQVDHINNNRTDNRLVNLRGVTNRQNNYNQSKRSKKCSSRWRGVSWSTFTGKWKVAIKLETKQKFLGYCTDEAEAAMLWNEGATLYYGEYANLNEANNGH